MTEVAPGKLPLLDDPSLLFTVAEIAVAFAGFSAIVVLFKRRDSGKWLPADADRFNGMLLHAMAAAFFSMLPAVIGIFTAHESRVWAIASALLGVQVVLHVVLVLTLATTRRRDRAALTVGVAAAVLLALNALGIGFDREFGPYLGGVLWHVFQSGVLFAWLIWIPREDFEAAESRSHGR